MAGVEERALTRATVPPSLLPLSTAGESRITPANALAVADCFACVRVLSESAASLPLIPYRRVGDGRERWDGPLADLLDRPAPATTQANLVGQLVAHLCLWGNSFIGKFRDASGRVAQIALLSPERVTPELRAGQPVYTVLDGRGGRSEHGPEDVIHVRGMSTDGLVGLSPVRQARAAIGLSADLAKHASLFFSQGGRPSGILRFPRAPTPEEEAKLGQGMQGLEGAHRIAVLYGGEDVSFTPLTAPMEDMQFLGQRHLSAQEVARIFRVPPSMIAAPTGDSLTYGNRESDALHFVTHSLRPWLVLIEQALSADRDLCPPGIYCEFLVDALLRADSATRGELYTRALDPATGWMTRAEVRRLENLPPEPQETIA